MMPIQINAPEVEQRLQKEAARRGVTAADYALEILHRHLPANGDASGDKPVSLSGDEATAVPGDETNLSVGSTTQARRSQFHRWVESHNNFPKLPPVAFERASFYEGQST